MAREWFERDNPLGAIRVIDSTRQPTTPKDTQLNTGYATADLVPREAAGWIEIKTRNTWRLVYAAWVLIGLATLYTFVDREIDLILLLSGAGVVAVLAFIPGWAYHEYVTAKVYGLFSDRYEGVTTKVTEQPPTSTAGRGVSIHPDAPKDTLKRLEAELKYVLIRAVHTPASLRDKETEIIPGVNVRLDKDLYRFLMYVLRELELVTGGKDPQTGKRKKWQCNYKSEALAKSAFERRKHRLQMLDLDEIAALADVEDWDE